MWDHPPLQGVDGHPGILELTRLDPKIWSSFLDWKSKTTLDFSNDIDLAYLRDLPCSRTAPLS